MPDSFSGGKKWNKIMLGFIVRKCAADLGRSPTPDEFAAWANEREEGGRRFNLFGRPISPSVAEVMLRRLGRLVTVHSESIVKGAKFGGMGR